MAGTTRRPVIISALLALFIVLAVAVARCGGTGSTLAPTQSITPQCNASLWAHVYDSSRLNIVDTCRTGTGTITDQNTNEVGDIDVRLEVDPAY